MPERLSKTRLLERRRTLQLMKRIMIHLRGQMDELLKPQGVTTAQLQMLRVVRDSPGASGAHLARECYVTPQTAQALLKHLEEDGFIVRGKDPVNDRIVTARITAAGERLLDNAEKIANSIQEKLWCGIANSDVDAMRELLERCLENIDGDSSTVEGCGPGPGR